MIKPIREDRKIMTRRVILVNGFLPSGAFWDHKGYYPFVCSDGILRFAREKETLPTKYSPELKCPYGKIGDHLWVREAFTFYPINGNTLYRANYDEIKNKKYVWKPSIHMPRTAARIFLEITDIRVERVQNISEKDEKVEGVEYLFPGQGEVLYRDYQLKTLNGCENAKDSFQSLWNKINAKRCYTWESNPWVWVISFRRIV
jgi:hypothetical protein